jgi:hypothetical protein
MATLSIDPLLKCIINGGFVHLFTTSLAVHDGTMAHPSNRQVKGLALIEHERAAAYATKLQTEAGHGQARSGTTPDAEETRAAAEDTLPPDRAKSPIIAAPAADKAP